MFLDPTFFVMAFAAIPNVLASADASSVSGLLQIAGELVTWLITQMTALITFITGQPVILIGMVITLAGLAVGMLMRIWHSAG